ncbi:DNA methyltransferase [Mesorhizobium sp. J8]|uniref:DNA methyltransferase n=1 Tax=Mesorhizobium sp. J8 TaxID=2777475 RepID=UPI0019159599|nr:DNA methyltransferase [Mesorhizobium sp. J8]BCM19229.1 hypothetical protein MJ8_30020 [Mesorhizobium sp. J8]
MRHPLHSICPYFAMFPESFVAEQLFAYTRPNELVFDPFCGRGTTVLESLLNDRRAIGSDINPVAACVAGAKAQVPDLLHVLQQVDELEKSYHSSDHDAVAQSEFFQMCFHPETYSEVTFLRDNLDWRNSSVHRFIAAVLLGILHGESHRSALALSNRMPRTISTKPDYSVRWWKKHGLNPPRRETFKILREAVAFRYSRVPPRKQGVVVEADSRTAGDRFLNFQGQVSLVVTSPPYLDTTDYSEDQWLRLWFLGGAERPATRLNRDDRLTVVGDYWVFLQDIWAGIVKLLRPEATIVVRIGGTRLSKEDLFEGLQTGLQFAMPNRKIRPLHQGRSSEIAKRQTNSFRPGTKSDRMEHDFAFRLG